MTPRAAARPPRTPGGPGGEPPEVALLEVALPPRGSVPAFTPPDLHRLGSRPDRPRRLALVQGERQATAV
eukprot:4459929-Pyramimonas_sp.AAC.1